MSRNEKIDLEFYDGHDDVFAIPSLFRGYAEIIVMTVIVVTGSEKAGVLPDIFQFC